MNSSNFKDKITNLCGLVFLVGGGLAVAPVPPNVKVIAGIASTIAGSIVAWFTGKAPSGDTKSDSQVKDQNVK